jgi:hypothetical protein
MPAPDGTDGRAVDLDAWFRTEVDDGIGQLRAVPVSLSDGRGILLVHSEAAEVDPYMKMFYFPRDTLYLTMLSTGGEVCWCRDLGEGVVPGMWFCPVFPFDLDGDGTDEVYFVDNVDDEHPLNLDAYRLARLDPDTGEVTARREWPVPPAQKAGYRYRNFVLGGEAGGDPVLVTAQGTYGPMALQGWNADMTVRWEHEIAGDDPGARGSHMCPVLDIDGDGIDELLWGERAIGLDRGEERFCAGRESWDGHSDVIQPTRNRRTGEWSIFTTRESHHERAPRVVCYDAAGERRWTAVDAGHVDMGWTARIAPDGTHRAMAIRIGHKSAGRSGFRREGVEEFVYEADTGEPVDLDYPVYGTIPIDVDGDGVHELAYGGVGMSGGDAAPGLIDRDGTELGSFGGSIALASKVLDHPGEQFLTFAGDGTVTLRVDANAEDEEPARKRYEHPYYRKAQRLTATGYNWVNLGGL